jgi:hypothetical protein
MATFKSASCVSKVLSHLRENDLNAKRWVEMKVYTVYIREENKSKLNYIKIPLVTGETV